MSNIVKNIITTFLVITSVQIIATAQVRPMDEGRPNHLGNLLPEEIPFRYPSLVDDYFHDSEENYGGRIHPTRYSDFGFQKSMNTFSDSVHLAWVSHYASNLLPGDDRARALAVDDSGYVYVTGWSNNPLLGIDYFTLKYEPSGTIMWAVRYNTEWDGDDWPTDISVDSFGNVYVTGRSEDSDGWLDYATIKYNENGNEQWISRYDNPENDDDWPTALTLDGSGNIYVTGYSGYAEVSKDYATVKYNSDGIEQWVAIYNGPESMSDIAHDIGVDNFGNVIVTGRSFTTGTHYDYATIKYDSLGNENWAVLYNGPASLDDWVCSIAIDEDGNVFITGTSSGLGTNQDYATIKYDSSGIEQWVARYNKQGQSTDIATALTVDDSGNTYVTGSSSGFVTIKYSPTGIQQWIMTYVGPGGSIDRPVDVAVDDSGNVYVAGESATNWIGPWNFSYATVKYNSDGLEQWVSRYDGPGNSDDEVRGMTVDKSGSVLVTGSIYSDSTNWDYTTVRYNQDGTEEWVERYNGVGTSADAPRLRALVIDDTGNIYVAGRTESNETSIDYVVVKYNSFGDQKWAVRYNGLANGNDDAVAIAVDGLRNVCVTGWSENSSRDADFITIKYNTEGAEQWIVRYSGPGNTQDQAIAVATDSSENVYVTGWSRGSGTSDRVTIKYNADGFEQWVAIYDGPGNSYDYASDIYVDAASNIYVTGSSMGLGTGKDYATIKYSADGVQKWVARYNGPDNSSDGAVAVIVDGNGSVYVTGSSKGTGPYNDYATIKYNSDGVEQWVARYDGPGNYNDLVTEIAVDTYGNVYVTGSSWESDNTNDYATVKYNMNGIEQWVARYDGPAGGKDGAYGIGVDIEGNVYVSGVSDGLSASADFATIKYNSDGNEEWIERFNGPGNAEDYVRSLSIDDSMSVVVSGFSRHSDSWDSWAIFTVVKYTQTPVGVEKQEPVTPLRYTLSQSFPNPFNARTTIQYELPKTSNISLIIYNLTGQEIIRWDENSIPPGYYEKTWNGTNKYGEQVASGIYLYRLVAGDYTAVKKMLLLK